MSAQLALPAPEEVARLLRDLFSRPVNPKKGQPLPPSTKVCAGTYADDTGGLVGVCVCDLPISASIGAALALIPAAAAADAVKASKIPAEIYENLREVLNIMAGLFRGTHVRFCELLPLAAVLPPPVASIVARPLARLDLELSIAGYAGGRLSLLIAPPAK
jgi:hypothetical protein